MECFESINLLLFDTLCGLMEIKRLGLIKGIPVSM